MVFMNQLPAQLLKYLADSELDLIQWDGTTNTLTFRLTKEIGPEEGILTFVDVHYVNVPSHLSIQSIEPQPYEDQWIYVLHESWGTDYQVIARECH